MRAAFVEEVRVPRYVFAIPGEISIITLMLGILGQACRLQKRGQLTTLAEDQRRPQK